MTSASVFVGRGTKGRFTGRALYGILFFLLAAFSRGLGLYPTCVLIEAEAEAEAVWVRGRKEAR